MSTILYIQSAQNLKVMNLAQTGGPKSQPLKNLTRHGCVVQLVHVGHCAYIEVLPGLARNPYSANVHWSKND